MLLEAGLVVEGEVAEELAVGGVDDADVEVCDEQGDVGAGVGSADADVVHAGAVSEGDGAGLVDAVVADAVVGAGAAGGAGLGEQVVGYGGCAPVEAAVGASVVVLVDEGVELGLEAGEISGAWLGGELALEGLLEAFDFAAGGGVVGSGVLLGDPEVGEGGLDALRWWRRARWRQRAHRRPRPGRGAPRQRYHRLGR